jgi:hypothetical protein
MMIIVVNFFLTVLKENKMVHHGAVPLHISENEVYAETGIYLRDLAAVCRRDNNEERCATAQQRRGGGLEANGNEKRVVFFRY